MTAAPAWWQGVIRFFRYDRVPDRSGIRMIHNDVLRTSRPRPPPARAISIMVQRFLTWVFQGCGSGK
jgi:hypothetical protein